MDNKNKQRLEQLVRQGIVPSRKLPILMTAMSSLHLGKQLTPTERDVLSKYMFNMTDIMLKDDTAFNRAKLHTQKTRYQTEETTVDLDEKMVDGVEIVDGPEEQGKKTKAMKKEKEKDMKEAMDPDEEEILRRKDQNKARRLSIKSRSKFRMLPKEIRKEKEKAGLDESIADINEDYKTMFEAALEVYGIDNIRDLPAEEKKEFFSLVDQALEEAKMAKKDHDGDGKVETSTAEYMGSRDKAIKKTIKLKGFGPDAGKSNMSNPAARAALMKKEEVELTFEEMTPQQKADRLRMVARAADRVQSGQAGKDAEKRAKADMKQKGAQKGMAPTKKDVQEQVAAIRKTIKEGSSKEKIEAYKELNQIIEQFKTTGEL
jgi:hypothetical protein